MQVEVLQNNEVVFSLDTNDKDVDLKASAFQKEFQEIEVEKMELVFEKGVLIEDVNDILSNGDSKGVLKQTIWLR